MPAPAYANLTDSRNSRRPRPRAMPGCASPATWHALTRGRHFLGPNTPGVRGQRPRDPPGQENRAPGRVPDRPVRQISGCERAVRAGAVARHMVPGSRPCSPNRRGKDRPSLPPDRPQNRCDRRLAQIAAGVPPFRISVSAQIARSNHSAMPPCLFFPPERHPGRSGGHSAGARVAVARVPLSRVDRYSPARSVRDHRVSSRRSRRSSCHKEDAHGCASG